MLCCFQLYPCHFEGHWVSSMKNLCSDHHESQVYGQCVYRCSILTPGFDISYYPNHQDALNSPIQHHQVSSWQVSKAGHNHHLYLENRLSDPTNFF